MDPPPGMTKRILPEQNKKDDKQAAANLPTDYNEHFWWISCLKEDRAHNPLYRHMSVDSVTLSDFHLGMSLIKLVKVDEKGVYEFIRNLVDGQFWRFILLLLFWGGKRSVVHNGLQWMVAIGGKWHKTKRSAESVQNCGTFLHWFLQDFTPFINWAIWNITKFK